MFLVGRHDLSDQGITLNLRDYVPKAEHTAQVLRVTVAGFASEEDVEHGKRDCILSNSNPVRLLTIPAMLFAPLSRGEFPRRLTQHALHPASRQIWQSIGNKE